MHNWVLNNFPNLIKGIARTIIRIVIEVIHRLVLNIFDTLFGSLNWPDKKLRIRIVILRSEQMPVVSPAEFEKAIHHAAQVFSKQFRVKLIPIQINGSFAEIVNEMPPLEVLHTKGGRGALIEEFKMAGNFFAKHLFTPVYPVSVFVVKSIKGATGCSLGPMTDYITLDPFGAKDATTLAHELAHACGLWHLNDRSNLLWNRNNRGDKIRWWQKNIFRGSRHVTYW